MKYTKIPETTFEELQMNAGIFTNSFEPESGEIGDILMATTGGATFTATPTFSDFGEDIDNVPNDMLELKELDQWDTKMSGTAVTVTTAQCKSFLAAADVSGDKITPRSNLKEEDYTDLWWVGDYGKDNSEETGGFLAIHLMNALSIGGLSLKSTKKGKGQFAFEYKGHYSIKEQDKAPFEIYIHSV